MSFHSYVEDISPRVENQKIVPKKLLEGYN